MQSAFRVGSHFGPVRGVDNITGFYCIHQLQPSSKTVPKVFVQTNLVEVIVVDRKSPHTATCDSMFETFLIASLETSLNRRWAGGLASSLFIFAKKKYFA